MKQIHPSQIESPEEQETRAQQRLRPKPMVMCALIIGAIVLVFPVAGPWMSQQAFISAMGRLLSKSWIVNIIAHFIFAIVYGAVIAAVIYRFRLAAALCFGALLGAGLYVANYLLFALALGYRGSNELHVCIEHIAFGLFFAAAYKAMSVPRPRWKATGRPVLAEDKH
jgi:hypothetical protein